MIILNDGNLAIDSIIFGVQTTDIAYGRCPNGTGGFGSINPPTFNALNCNQTSIYENGSANEIVIFPNPSGHEMQYLMQGNLQVEKITMTNSLGQVVKSVKQPDQKAIGSDLLQGLYQVVFQFADGTIRTLKWMKM